MSMGKEIAICRKHWITFASDALWIVAALIAAAAFAGADSGGALSLGMVVLAGVMAARALITYKCTYVRLTETSVIGHVGFLKSKTLTTSIVKVQDMGLSNGLLGKILGYHTITISSAGSAGTEFVFRNMANAQRFVERMQEQIAAKQ